MRYRTPPRDSTYWLLPSPDPHVKNAALRSELQGIGYKPKKSASRADLVALLKHAHLGHICYDNCAFDELKRFALDRGLVSKKAGPASARLVSLLLKADMNPTFNRFSDLPPELRVRIYNLYMADFSISSFQHPVDPPLTRTNRLIRSESLPIFYQRCTFRLAISGQARYTLRVIPSSRKFLRTLSALKLRHIRHLEIFLSIIFDLDLTEADELTRARISFSPAMESYDLSFSQSVARPWRPGLGAENPAVEAKLRGVFDGVVSRGGADKLQARDLLGLDHKEMDLLGAVVRDMDR